MDMPQRTPQRPTTTSRFPRSAGSGGGVSGRGARTGRPSTTGGRFGRPSTSSPSSARFGRPTSQRKPKNTSRRDQLPFGGSKAKKKSGSGKGLLGLAGALGTAKKKAPSAGG